MKRILLLTDFFRPEPGGLEALFTGIVRQWQPEDVEVIVAADRRHYFCNESDIRTFDQKEAYPVHRTSGVSNGLWIRRRREGIEALFRERLDQFHPDHVLLSDINRTSRIIATRAYLAGIPYSVFLTGGNLKNKLGFTRILERRLVMGARNIFAISRYLARDARGYGIPEDRITVLPPGFVPRWAGRRRNPLPEKLQSRVKNRVLLLGLGPFLPRKGFDVAIQALRELRDLRHHLHFVLTGSGPEYTYLKELVRIHELQDMVSMTGFLNDAALASLFQRADILIQPGREVEDDVESLGMVFMEAAYFGIPVIAGRLGGVEEIVRHGVSGFVVAPGSVEETTERVRQLAESEKLRQRFGRNAKDIARRDFDMERTAAAIEVRI